MKRDRRHSDYRKGMLVYVDRRPDDFGVGIEMSAPKVMAQDKVGSGVRPMLVTRMKEPALRRLHPQHVKVIS